MTRIHPYTPAGLLRVTCSHCGKHRCRHEWGVTEIGHTRQHYYGLCELCDTLLTAEIVAFLKPRLTVRERP